MKTKVLISVNAGGGVNRPVYKEVTGSDREKGGRG